ncbi:MAG TPA: M10 family metallopeptidase C-terminal domain-containing protein, partial [Sphingomonas sp.]|nr:M10 family metallopeptidase C-terminal domain-containing protein [Sphingomonas sp.]
EGPNEINNWPVTYQGLTGLNGGVAFLNAAAAAAKASPQLANLPIYGLSGAPRVAATTGDASQFVNIHPYAQHGDQPYDGLAARIGAKAIATKGMVITEAGYHTGVGNKTWEGVDEATQAKLTLNLLADATKLGVAQTYLYQLTDLPDPTGVGADAHLGLFDTSFRPKPVATAIHNLTSILADSGAAADSFQVHRLDYTLSNLPAHAQSLLLEKSNGEHALMLWAEPDIWNETTDKAIAVAPTASVVTFAGPVDVRVYDPLAGDQPIATYAHVTKVQVALSDHPVVIEVAGGTGAVTAPATYAPPITMTGTANADTLAGRGGDDTLKGMGGDDRIDGGAGADIIIGGAGADRLTGGAGADLFTYKTAGESHGLARDTILDFNAADGDRIDLSAIDANARLAGDQAFRLAGDHFTNAAGQLIQTDTRDGLLVQGDQNGDGRAEFAVLLQGVHTPLSPDAFIL